MAFFLLMFNDAKSRRNLLESRFLFQWFETIQEWSSDIKLDRRHVWLAFRGVPIQAWSKHTFKNIAEVWGSLVYIDKDTYARISFEQGCILIEMYVMNRIEDVVELVVNGRLYPVRVQEMESLFRTDVDSDEDESGSEESTEKEEAQHDVLDHVSEIGIEKTPIKTAGVVEESSTTDKLISNKMVRESKGTIVPDSLGDVPHGLKQDLLEVT
ncbi:hypothetical protein GQ457_11G028210 [Hibiscus cannabinus]